MQNEKKRKRERWSMLRITKLTDCPEKRTEAAKWFHEKWGISPLYLLTEHIGFYERYGWTFCGMAQGDGEDFLSRIYMHN